MMKKIYYSISLILILFFLLPFIYLLLPGRVKDYVYRELCYHTIADKIKSESTDFDDFLKKLSNYVYVNIDSHMHNMPAIDDNSWNCFVRGFGYCDQQAWAFATLLAKKGIPARLVMLHSSLSSGHSIAEVYVDGQWIVTDPGADIIHYNKYAKLATFNDIKEGLVTINGAPKEQISPELYRSYFTDENPPERWGALTTKQGKMRKLLFFPVFAYYKLFGFKFSKFYQNLYLIGADNKTAQRNRYLIDAAGNV